MPPPMPAPQGFSSGLFDCCSDGCSCWAAMCCAPTVVAQLTQRITRRQGVCIVIALILWSCMAVQVLFGHPPVPEGEQQIDPYTGLPYAPAVPYEVPVYVYIAGVAGPIMLILTCCLRHTVRERYGIPAGTCSCCGGWLEDCFLSCCCACCVQAQILRHEGLTGGRYNLMAPEGVAVMV